MSDLIRTFPIWTLVKAAVLVEAGFIALTLVAFGFGA